MLRRYKYVRTTETIERDVVPLKRPQKRIKIIEREVVPFERAAGPTETIERELAPLVQSGLTLRWPRWRPKLGRLALGSLALAVLGGLSLVMLTMLVCAAVGLWSWSGPNEADTVARRPMIRSRLAPLATMPLLAPAEAVVELATPLAAVANPTAPPVLPTATPMPPPPTAAPPAAASQATSKPKLTSLVVLNVRAGPGVDHPVVGKLAAGQSAAVTGQNPEGTWWQIEYPAASGGLAWVSANPQYSTVNRTGETLIAQGPTPATGAASPPASTPATQAPSSPTAAAPTPVSSPAVTAPDSTAGWSFAATRVDAIPTRKMLMLFGEMTNETGAAQQISTVTGTFYDAQDQVIAADKSTYGLWPTNVVPPGGRVPFALTVYDIKEAAKFDLAVQAKPAAIAPRQDFEFVGVSEQMKGNNYCLAGALKNPGATLEKQLVIAAILYDEQGKVLRFGNSNKTAFQNTIGEQTLDFEVCIKSPPENVTRHELIAWGS